MKRFAKLWVCSLTLTIAIAFGSGQAAVAQSTDPASVMIAYARAFPGDAALELFRDDAVVRIIPPLPNTSGVWTGKDEIRQLLQFAKSQNASMEIIGSPQVEGNKVTARTMNHSDLFRRLGVSPVEHAYEVVVEDGKIKSLMAAITPAEQARIAAARQAQSGQPSVPATAPAPAAGSIGMPRTGIVATLPLFGAAALSIVSIVAGVVLRRRSA